MYLTSEHLPSPFLATFALKSACQINVVWMKSVCTMTGILILKDGIAGFVILVGSYLEYISPCSPGLYGFC